MRLSSLNVAVVGAAVGGAATALLLARAGAKVTIYERVECPTVVGAGIALQPNGLAVLDGLGLADALKSRGAVLDALSIVDAHQRPLLRPTLPVDDAVCNCVLMIRRSELHQVLHDALSGESNITAHFGTTVLSASAEGIVRTQRTRDSAEGPTARYDLVVGADGVWSRIRGGPGVAPTGTTVDTPSAVDLNSPFGSRVRRTGIRYARGLVEAKGSVVAEAWTKAGIFGSFPVMNGTYYYFSAGTKAVRDALTQGDLTALQRAWADAYPPSREILADVQSTTDILVHEVVRVDCDTFFDGRVVLVGDAAHAMAPNLGQGANSALVDAAVLCHALRSELDLQAALSAYDRRRRPAVRWVQDAADAGGALSEQTSTLVRLVRDRLLMPLARLGTTSRMRKALQVSPGRLRRMIAESQA